MRRLALAILVALRARPFPAGAQQELSDQAMLVGGEFTYTVQPGDSLARIGARLGVRAAALAEENRLDPSALLKVGQALRVDNRHIVPRVLEHGILINLPQRMLFYYVEGNLLIHFPVGVGRPDWPTPTGEFWVIRKEVNPVWHVPRSIQEEMRRNGQEVKTRVPPGPDNPLGKYWIGLSLPCCYGIHGTIAPGSIYQFLTHGCVRLHPDDIADLFGRVSLGTVGEIIYEPVLLTRLEDGRIYLEVHRDIYRRGVDMLQRVQHLAAAQGLDAFLDWQRVQQVVDKREGIAREVTLPPLSRLDEESR